MVDRNSHVARVITPPGHPFAVQARVACAEATILQGRVTIGSTEHGVLTLQSRRFECACGRRNRDLGYYTDGENEYLTGRTVHCSWSVWAPIDFVLRPCDVGPCPNCDKWNGPLHVTHADDRVWDSVALRIGETVAWHELSDRSVLEIAALTSRFLMIWMNSKPRLSSSERHDDSIRRYRRDLGFALAEAAYRDMLPTPEDLRIACDLAEARGVLTPDAIERWTLAELWARCMPLLWSLRGDREV